MVNQVNDKSLSQLTGLVPGVANTARPTPASNTSSPAVRLALSEATQAGKAPAPAVVQDLASSELVQEIRRRVQSGSFVIDYEQVGQALLRDVVAQAVGRRS